jgi:hypothetical protein
MLGINAGKAAGPREYVSTPTKAYDQERMIVDGIPEVLEKKATPILVYDAVQPMVAEGCFASVNGILLTIRKAALLRSRQYVPKRI